MRELWLDWAGKTHPRCAHTENKQSGTFICLSDQLQQEQHPHSAATIPSLPRQMHQNKPLLTELFRVGVLSWQQEVTNTALWLDAVSRAQPSAAKRQHRTAWADSGSQRRLIGLKLSGVWRWEVQSKTKTASGKHGQILKDSAHRGF